MAVEQENTRKDIRLAVGENFKVHVGEATSAGDEQTLIDVELAGDDDDKNDSHLVFHDGSNSGLIRRVNDYDAGTWTMSWNDVLPTATADGDTYELWPSRYDPKVANRFINNGIRHITGRFFNPVVDESLHGDHKQTTRFAVPSTLDMIHRVEWRTRFKGEFLHTCNAVWDELVDGDASAALDNKDFRRQTASVKLTVGAGLGNGDVIATDSIASKDLTGYTHIEFWAKARVAVAASDLALLLDDTAQCASPLETLTLPALTAGTWTRVRLALSNPAALSAIISVGLEYNANAAANTIWIDDIVAMDDGTQEWATLNQLLWSVNRDTQELVLHPGGRRTIGYARIRLVGGAKPALVDSDDDIVTVPYDFIVNWVTGHMMLGEGGGSSTDPDSHHPRAAAWFGAAQDAEKRIYLPSNTRMVR